MTLTHPLFLSVRSITLLSLLILSLVLGSFSFFSVPSAHALISGAGSGLVGHWTFDEGSGTTAADSSGSGNTGTLINGPTWTTGKIGAALNFDGVNDYMNLGNGASLGVTGDITIAAWINPTDFANFNGILSKTAGGLPAPYDTYIGTNGRPKILRGDGTNYKLLEAHSSIASGVWTHVALISSGDNASIYINGVLSNSGTMILGGTNAIANGTTNARIGTRQDLFTLMKGRLDDVRLYNRALTAANVTELYNYIGAFSPPSDTQAPTTPTNLIATVISSSRINLSWSASTDNVGVTGYRIFRNGTQIATVAGTSYSNTGLSPSTNYSYTVAAYDAAGNTSMQSSSVSVTTQAGTTGNTITAASCSSANVQTAINAAVDGDTVIVPAGTCTWTTPVTITNKSISLIGAGIGGTIISGSGAGTLIWVTKAAGGSPAGFTRMSGFTWKTTGGGGCTSFDGISAAIQVSGLSQNWRADNNRFESTTCGMLRIRGGVIGVVDNNQIVNVSCNLCHPLIIEHQYWNNVGDLGDRSWAVASSIGTVNALFVEDNTFSNLLGANGIYQTDDWKGARSVYRFNTWINSVWASHGTESGGRPRGFRHVEMYRNTFNYALTQIESIGGLRGGTGMLFDNVLTGAANQMFAFTTFRRNFNVTGVGYYLWGGCGSQTTINLITRSGTTATVTTSGEHFVHGSGSWVTITGATENNFNRTAIGTRTSATTFTYAVGNTGATTAGGTPVKSSPFDGNMDSTGYACLDQLGRGAGVYYSGYEPNVITPVAPAAQTSEPVYCWNNLDDGVLNACNAASATDIIVSLRDFYNQNTAFNGTTQRGIGRGVRSARPSSCTPNDAWWATDGGGNWNIIGGDGGLDKCTATNVWTNDWYVPYTYPHPLQSGGAIPTPPSIRHPNPNNPH